MPSSPYFSACGTAWARFRVWLTRPVPALPLDLFRVATGVLSLGYFVRLLLETETFSSPSGLLDHQLLSRVLWFTRWSLFQPGMPEWSFYLAYSVGALASLAVLLGIRPRLASVVAFVVAASQSRWNFVVFSVDDSIVHLCLFWLILLPVGRTVTLRGWLARRASAWRRWAVEDVPGGTTRLLLANLCLVYLTAGLSKLLASDYWREGFALYAILRQPISYAPDLWRPEDLPFLRIAAWLAIATELALPWLLTRRTGSWLKGLGAVLLVGFHLGIAATIRVPFANLALIGSLPLFFRDELVTWARHPGMVAVPSARVRSLRAAERLALTVVLLLSLAMLRRVPVVGAVHRPAFALLWGAGLAQDYHLFDWVDGLSFHVEETVSLQHPGGQEELRPGTELYPRSMRHVLLQVYLHGLPWMAFPRTERQALREAIATRTARRYCRRVRAPVVVTLTTTLQRIEPSNPALDRGRRQPVLTFACPGPTGPSPEPSPRVWTFLVRRR